MKPERVEQIQNSTIIANGIVRLSDRDFDELIAYARQKAAEDEQKNKA